MTTKLFLTKFNIIKALKPTPTDENARIRRYWNDCLGINVSDMTTDALPKDNYYIYSRQGGLQRKHKVTDNIENLGEYKKGDIIKSKRSYVRIEFLEITNNIYLVGEDLGSGLTRRYPLTMRSMKTYDLNQKILDRLEEQKKAFKEKQKNFDKDLKEMLKQRRSRKPVESINRFKRFQAVRK